MTSEAVVAYLAGIIDGEGCINLNKKHANGRKSTWRIRVQMNDREALLLLHDTFGGSLEGFETNGYQPPSRRGTNRKPIFVWNLNRQSSVEAALRCLLPYLRVKRKKAEDALAQISFPE